MSIEDPNASGGNVGATTNGVQDQAKADLNEVTSKAREDLDAVTQRAAEDVRNLSHRAGEKLGEARDQAKSFAADQKSLAARQINGVASAITRVADELEGGEQASVARYARDLAKGISGVGRQVEERDVDDLMAAAQDFGRRQPLAFLGLATLAGFAASRFALASAHRQEHGKTGGPSVPSSPTNAATPPSPTGATQQRFDQDNGGL
ncbi:nutrient deprivation-induced protein [Nostoc sp. 3335mG]|nr:nutrient deprivation-induced protein [Nostoc sp. 3335mG]